MTNDEFFQNIKRRVFTFSKSVGAILSSVMVTFGWSFPDLGFWSWVFNYWGMIGFCHQISFSAHLGGLGVIVVFHGQNLISALFDVGMGLRYWGCWFFGHQIWIFAHLGWLEALVPGL
jgi:hypothetical protein